MKFSKKDVLIILISLVIVGIAYPFLPDRIPRQFRLDGTVTYMAKEYIFILGLLPYSVYKLIESKKNR